MLQFVVSVNQESDTMDRPNLCIFTVLLHSLPSRLTIWLASVPKLPIRVTHCWCQHIGVVVRGFLRQGIVIYTVYIMVSLTGRFFLQIKPQHCNIKTCDSMQSYAAMYMRSKYNAFECVKDTLKQQENISKRKMVIAPVYLHMLHRKPYNLL